MSPDSLICRKDGTMKRLCIAVWLGLGLAVCRSASAADAAPTTATTTISLSLPGLTWGIEVTAPAGLVVDSKEVAPDGEAARLMSTSRANLVFVSIYLEKVPVKGDAKACRDYYWTKAKQSPFQKEQIRLSESGPMALVEYLVPEAEDRKVNQKNVNAYLAEGDYWMDVHLSQMDYQGGAQDPLAAIVKTIRIRRMYAATVSDRVAYGTAHYGQKAFPQAIAEYEKALELEKRQPTLDRKTWIVLVDQLGMAYGMSGDLAKAKQLYEWALTKEPEYPMFFYNLACTFAEEGKRDDALRNLRQANKFKDKMLPGEKMPDPTKDSSFAKCLEDKTFSDEVGKMKW